MQKMPPEIRQTKHTIQKQMKTLTTILILLCCSLSTAQELKKEPKSKPSQEKVCKCKKPKNKPVKYENYANNKTANKRPKWDKKPERY